MNRDELVAHIANMPPEEFRRELADARRERAAGMSKEWKPGSAEFAAEQIDALDADDPEVAHGNADAILLANVHPDVAAAYQRLIERCRWWGAG